MAKNYFLKYNHKKVMIRLIDGSSCYGILHTSKEDPFCFELEDEQKERCLFFKHSVLLIKVIP